MTSILAGWQGVNASSVFPGFDAPSNVTGLRTEMFSRNPTPAQPGQAQDDIVQASAPPDSSPSTIQFVTAIPEEAGQGQGQSWPLELIRSVRPSPAAEASRPVLVAVLDTGIDGGHEDLAGKVVADIAFIEDASTHDYYGHGTPIAGIIAADADNGLGVAGVAPESRLINIKVADDTGKCEDVALAEGIIWAADNGASVINVSIEMKGSTHRLQQAVDYAWDRGAIVIAAAGNDGDSLPVYPAAYQNCLSVTAIRENGELAPLANFGAWVDVAAPGFDIYSTLPGNTYGHKHGTSFAAAYVSGLAALLFPRVTDVDGDGRLNTEVLDAIYAGCRDTGIMGTGRGVIDVAGSLELATGN